MRSEPFFQDGDFSTPVRTSRRPRQYPFAHLGDLATFEYDAGYAIHIDRWTPSARGSLDPEARAVALSSADTATDVITAAAAHRFTHGQGVYLVVTSGLTGLATATHYWVIYAGPTTLKLAATCENISGTLTPGAAVDITADGTGILYEACYLFGETTPRLTGDNNQGTLATFTRTYGSLPPTQTDPAHSYRLNLPSPNLSAYPGTLGDLLITQPDAAIPKFDVYLPQTVAADSGLSTTITGGTYTISFGGYTTSALAYNAAASTIQSALNALTSVTAYGGATVAGSLSTGFTVTFNSYSAASADTSLLTGNAEDYGTANVSTDNGGFRQFVTLKRNSLTIATASLNAGSLTNSIGISKNASVTPLDSGHTQIAAVVGGPLPNGGISLNSSLRTADGAAVTGYAIQNNFPGFDFSPGQHFYFQACYAGSGGGKNWLGSGTFTLSAYGQTTAALPYTCTAAQVLAAINTSLTNLLAKGTLANFRAANGTPGYPSANNLPDLTGTGIVDGIIICFDLIPYAVTGGTYTLTVLGQTTSSLAYNASSSTVQSAVNALSNVIAAGGCTIAGGYVDSRITLTITFLPPSFTGGTFTLTIFSQTTAAIAYNASASAVAAALNALSNVAARGGITCTGDIWNGSDTIAFSFVFAASTLSIATASLTPSPAASRVSPDVYGRIQAYALFTQSTDRFIIIPAHGFSIDSSDYLFFNRAGTRFYGAAWNYADPNTIRVDASAAPFNNATLFTEVGRRTCANYSPGAKDVPAEVVTRFSFAALDPDTFQGDDASVLQAILAGAGLLNVQVGQTTRWPDAQSPIRAIDTTVIDIADALAS